MSADLTKLDPGFRDKIYQLVANCGARGVRMRPYMSIRCPLEQAKLWRQSRSIEQINAQIAMFKSAGAAFLADCLHSAGPQHGKLVTSAPPGLSWHQWGEAVDCFWLVDGQAEWSTDRLIDGVNGYHVYANEAHNLGLTAGGAWAMKDWPHVQLRPDGSPTASMSLAQVDEEMRKRFGA